LAEALDAALRPAHDISISSIVYFLKIWRILRYLLPVNITLGYVAGLLDSSYFNPASI
tara:strand:- start:239 stop:412 length:174 start_codon:yes stop_codon:yes gene_type:complete